MSSEMWKVSIIPEMRWQLLEGSLLSHPGFSWLDPLFSVWRKWWRGPRPPALSRSVSHTSRASVCMCVWHYRARSTHFSANNHITQGIIHSNAPLPPVCKVVWCGKQREVGVWQWSRLGFWVQMKGNVFHINITS